MKKPKLPKIRLPKVTPDRVEIVGFLLAVLGLSLLGYRLDGVLSGVIAGLLAAAVVCIVIGEAGD